MSQFSLRALKQDLTPEEVKVLNRQAWRSTVNSLNFSYSRMMGNSFQFAIMPFLSWIYPKEEDLEKKMAAIQRTCGFWNCEQTTTAFAIAMIASMELQASRDENFDVASINAVKASLIGPLSAIGDVIFWVTWRIIVTGIALSFSLQGSVLGPLLFVVVYNFPKMYARFYLTFLGYRLGMDFLQRASKSGILQHIITTFTIIGLTMIGGMTATLVNVRLALTFRMQGVEQSFLSMFNGIFRGSLDLAVVLFMMWLVRKKAKPSYIVLATLAVCVLGKYVGVF